MDQAKVSEMSWASEISGFQMEGKSADGISNRPWLEMSHMCIFLLHFLLSKFDKDERSLISMAVAGKMFPRLWNKSLNKSCFVVAIFINLCETMLTTLTCMNSHLTKVALHISIQYVQHPWLVNKTSKGFLLQSNEPLNIGNMSCYQQKGGVSRFQSEKNYHISVHGLQAFHSFDLACNLNWDWFVIKTMQNLSITSTGKIFAYQDFQQTCREHSNNRSWIAVASTSKTWISSVFILQY